MEAANLSEALWLVACGQALQFLGQRGPARNCLHSHLTAESVATGADPEPKWFQPQRRVGFSANMDFRCSS